MRTSSPGTSEAATTSRSLREDVAIERGAGVIAYYLQAPDPQGIDRARAVLEAVSGSDGVIVSPRRAPLGWPTPWTNLGSEGPEAWRAWVAEHTPSMVVVDGADEHLHDVRAAGRTVAVMAAPGAGWPDTAGAFGDADLVLAPWAAGADDGCPVAWRDRTLHLGAVGWAARQAVRGRALSDTTSRVGGRCVALAPTDGGPGPRERRRMLVETPGWRWWRGSERDVLSGGPTWAHLERADVVLCAPTPGNLAAVVAARVPAVLVLPQHPTDSEHFLAGLARQTAPVVVARLPVLPHQWRLLLGQARQLDGAAWAGWDPEPSLRTLRSMVGRSRSNGRVSL